MRVMNRVWEGKASMRRKVTARIRRKGRARRRRKGRARKGRCMSLVAVRKRRHFHSDIFIGIDRRQRSRAMYKSSGVIY